MNSIASSPQAASNSAVATKAASAAPAQKAEHGSFENVLEAATQAAAEPEALEDIEDIEDSGDASDEDLSADVDAQLTDALGTATGDAASSGDDSDDPPLTFGEELDDKLAAADSPAAEGLALAGQLSVVPNLATVAASSRVTTTESIAEIAATDEGPLPTSTPRNSEVAETAMRPVSTPVSPGAPARAPLVPSELAQAWAARAATGRARVVVGSGDDRVAVLVALEKEGVRIVAEAAAAETAEFLTRRAPELEHALGRHGRDLIELTATTTATTADGDTGESTQTRSAVSGEGKSSTIVA